MVRLLLVRHAESRQNAFMAGLLEELAGGTFDGTEFNRRMRNAPAGSAAGDDAELTSKGLQQAEDLASAWAPLLQPKVAAKKLLVFVSPFLRTLQTADPLLRELQKSSADFEAVILPAIMEEGGLTDADDFRKFDHIDALRRDGKQKEAMEYFKTLSWKPQGFSGRQIAARFPWARAATESDLRELSSDLRSGVPWEFPWWTGGYETRRRAHQRVEALAAWVSSLKNRIGDDVAVLLITHGGTIAQLTSVLLSKVLASGSSESAGLSTDGVRNTSVTSLLLPSPDFGYVGERPGASGSHQRFAIKMELFNDTSHLGPASLHDWSTFHARL